MRNHSFCVGEYYHVYNRGVDKRNIFADIKDMNRFLQILVAFNVVAPIGSLHQLQFSQPSTESQEKEKLVDVIAYCLNPNHFHMLITPRIEGGVEKYMQKIAGYTRYFNERHDRSGALFQGTFKSKHVASNEYLLHLSSYINMNNRNALGEKTAKLSESSLEEYISDSVQSGICTTAIILEQYASKASYKKFAFDAWEYTQYLKTQNKEMNESFDSIEQSSSIDQNSK